MKRSVQGDEPVATLFRLVIVACVGLAACAVLDAIGLIARCTR